MRRADVKWDAVTQAALPSPQVTHLHLLRHGEVDTGGERLAYGHLDLPLTAAGRRAEADLLAFARDQLPAITGVLSSDLSRCRGLGEGLSRALGVPLVLDAALREQHMGAWEGRSWAALTDARPAEVHAYWADYLDARPPEGESLRDLAARVDAWWQGVHERLAGGRWVVVTHVGVIRVLLCRALGVPLDQALRFAPGRGTHTHLLHADTGWVVQALGEQVAGPATPPQLAAPAASAPPPAASAPPPAASAAARAPTIRRLALSGSAGTGKTTLGQALARRLDLPYIPEGMRARLERGLDLHALDHDQFRALLWELWQEQVQAEDDAVAASGGFVADRSPYDYAAFWLHYRFATDREGTARFFEATHTRATALDRVLVLPWGALPLHADGVRSPNPWLQRHFQACVEGLLARASTPERLLYLPPLDDFEARLAWVLDRL